MIRLAVDIGNTNATFAVCDELDVQETFTASTQDILAGKTDSLKSRFLELRSIAEMGIASVVPHATEPVATILRTLFPPAYVRILKNSDIPIINRYHQPQTVGIDRLLASLSGYRLYAEPQRRPLISIDLGTATTYDCTTINGEYLGGLITLGVAATAEQLASRTAALPKIELKFPEHVLGTTTDECIRSGILYSALDAMGGIINRLIAEQFTTTKPLVISTGGLSSLFEGRAPFIELRDPFLVLKGIVITLMTL